MANPLFIRLANTEDAIAFLIALRAYLVQKYYKLTAEVLGGCAYI
ncbi:hypothetical protein [Nostoc sp.]